MDKQIMDSRHLLGQEWQTLQTQYEQHERNALLIKLSCFAFWLAGLIAQLAPLWIGVTILLCWAQEAIFKTYQTRLGDRLCQVETMLGATLPAATPMQLHSGWLATRPDGTGLILGYASSAGRPTVAFPYLPLLAMLLLGHWLAWL